MTQEYQLTQVDIEQELDGIIRTALAWGAVYGRIIIASGQWDEMREQMVHSMRQNFVAALSKDSSIIELLSKVVESSAASIALLRAAKDVVQDGRVADIGGADIAVTSCDAFEQLKHVLDFAYPSYMSGLTQPEIDQVCKNTGSNNDQKILEKCRQNGALWMVAKS